MEKKDLKSSKTLSVDEQRDRLRKLLYKDDNLLYVDVGGNVIPGEREIIRTQMRNKF